MPHRISSEDTCVRTPRRRRTGLLSYLGADLWGGVITHTRLCAGVTCRAVSLYVAVCFCVSFVNLFDTRPYFSRLYVAVTDGEGWCTLLSKPLTIFSA